MKSTTLTLIALFALSFVATSAHAQVGIYGEFSTTHVSENYVADTPAAWYPGFTAGVYDSFFHAGLVGLGFDLRGGYGRGQGHGYRSFLIGPRLDLRTPVLPIHPYIQAAIGFGGVEYNGIPASDTHYKTKLQYGVIGGIDYTLIPHLDLRLAEVEYLRMSPTASAGSPPALTLVNVGAGLVLRLP